MLDCRISLRNKIPAQGDNLAVGFRAVWWRGRMQIVPSNYFV
jgi:hypothetical protein